MENEPVREHTLDNLKQTGRGGNWLIEGFKLKQITPRVWLILNPPEKGQRLQFQSLNDARNWIVNELNGTHK
jgi:hypothetical protein